MNNIDEIRIRDILYSLKKRIKVIILTALIGLAFGAGLWGYKYYQSRKTESFCISASIAVTSQTDDGRFTDDSLSPKKTDVELAEQMVDSVIYVCKSRKVLKEAVKRNELLGISTSDIYNNIFFTQYNKTQIIEIRFYWPNEEEGIQILTSITEIVPGVLMETLKIGNVSVINDPIVVAVSNKPDIKLILIGLLGGIFLGVVYALIMYVLKPALVRVSDVKEKLGVLVLGQISEDKTYSRRASAGTVDFEADRNGPFRESFGTLANILLGITEREKHVTMFITSSGEGEGKSTITANMGWELARIGKKVLMIDFDTVRPSLASIFGIKTDYEHSLNAVYFDDVSAEDAMTKIGNDLYLLPAKIDSKNIVIDGNAGEIIAHMKAQFDIVLIDTSALGQSADTFRFSSMTDYALFVVAFDDLSINTIADRLDSLKKTNVNIVGCVVNRITDSSFNRLLGAFGNKKSNYKHTIQTEIVGEGDQFEAEIDRRLNELKGENKK